jgi:hypothetical protein
VRRFIHLLATIVLPTGITADIFFDVESSLDLDFELWMDLPPLLVLVVSAA